MTLDANTYGTVALVEAMVGDLVESRTFGVTTTPTLAQVEGYLDLMADELNMELKMVGYVVPVATATDPEAYGWLQRVNSMGAAMLVIGSLPLAAWIEPGAEETPAQTRRMFYEKQFHLALQRIRERRIPASVTTSGRHELVVGSSVDSEGNTKLPIFTRGFGDYPGSRSLTGSEDAG